MKKKILAFLMAAATCLTLTACKDSSNDSGNSGSGNSDSSKPISLRVWGPEEDQALLTEMVNKFKAAYPDKEFNIEIGVESEAKAKDDILTDVSAAADVYAFASDQLNELIAAGALAELSKYEEAIKNISGKTLDDIKAQNMEGAVAAATKNGSLYALPLGAGNNYFMCYDKTVVSEEAVATWDGLLAAAGSANKKVGMVLNSGWWNGGFFLGAGFTVSSNDDNTTNCKWNGTSSTGVTGVQVVEGMLNIAGNKAFMAIDDGMTMDAITSGELCAIVTGSWDAEACEKAWGKDNVGYAKLPTYTAGGNQVQQGCYSGFKLMGVNGMSKEIGWATVLAEFLTNEEAQTMRFAARQLAPTNNKAAAADAVTSNKMIAASLAQDAACGVLQDVGGNYWAPTKTFGAIIAQGELKVGDTDAIQTALDNMVAGVTAPIA